MNAEIFRKLAVGESIKDIRTSQLDNLQPNRIIAVGNPKYAILKVFSQNKSSHLVEREYHVSKFLRSIGFTTPAILWKNKNAIAFEYIKKDKNTKSKLIKCMTIDAAIAHGSFFSLIPAERRELIKFLEHRDRENRFRETSLALKYMVNRGLLDPIIATKQAKNFEVSLKNMRLHTFAFYDYFPENAMISNGKTVHFDFERASYTTSAFDLACLILSDPEHKDAIITAYKRAVCTSFRDKNLKHILNDEVSENNLRICMQEKCLVIAEYLYRLNTKLGGNNKKSKQAIKKYVNYYLNLLAGAPLNNFHKPLIEIVHSPHQKDSNIP